MTRINEAKPHAIADGHADIIALPTRQIPVSWSTEGMWGEFQYYNRGAAGVLRFSPIGFTPVPLRRR